MAKLEIMEVTLRDRVRSSINLDVSAADIGRLRHHLPGGSEVWSRPVTEVVPSKKTCLTFFRRGQTLKQNDSIQISCFLNITTLHESRGLGAARLARIARRQFGFPARNRYPLTDSEIKKDKETGGKYLVKQCVRRGCSSCNITCAIHKK